MARRTTADKRRERTRCPQPSPICWRGKKTTIAKAMDGATAMVMDGAMATRRQRRWTARWRRDGDRRRDGDATAATATAMEGASNGSGKGV
jgi:hypothetical protein